MNTRIWLLSSFLFLAAGCGGGHDDPVDLPVGVAAEFQTIESSSFSGLGGAARNLVIDNPADWQSFWAQHKSGTPDAQNPPPVDFSRETVVALVQSFSDCSPLVLRSLNTAPSPDGPSARPVIEVAYASPPALCIPGPYQPVKAVRITNPSHMPVSFKLTER